MVTKKCRIQEWLPRNVGYRNSYLEIQDTGMVTKKCRIHEWFPRNVGYRNSYLEM